MELIIVIIIVLAAGALIVRHAYRKIHMIFKPPKDPPMDCKEDCPLRCTMPLHAKNKSRNSDANVKPVSGCFHRPE